VATTLILPLDEALGVFSSLQEITEIMHKAQAIRVIFLNMGINLEKFCRFVKA